MHVMNSLAHSRALLLSVVVAVVMTSCRRCRVCLSSSPPGRLAHVRSFPDPIFVLWFGQPLSHCALGRMKASPVCIYCMGWFVICFGVLGALSEPGWARAGSKGKVRLVYAFLLRTSSRVYIFRVAVKWWRLG